MKKIFLLLLFAPNLLYAQTDYDQLTNWYYHPEKSVNFIESYDLDIAIIDKNLQVDSIIQIENQAGTNTGIDVFWVHPTHLTNPPNFPTNIPISSQNTSYINAVILAQGAVMAKYGRFYAPKYRQASPASFLGFNFSEQERADALLETYADIKAAFLHYLQNYNGGNRIILAGHSQGAFLLGMLLRDLFDEDPQLRSQLLTASLGGMGYVYTAPNMFRGGWWKNIPLCTVSNECNCVHYWRSYEESKDIPQINTAFPSFNQVLVDSGVVFRTPDLSNDQFLQDSLFYGTSSSPLRYYIAPDAGYNFAPGYNIIAFDSLYAARFKRESETEVGLAIEYMPDANDLRPNDIDSSQNNPFFSDGDLHIKDYHIYSWALMEQIDSKLEECFLTTHIKPQASAEGSILVYPNPHTGTCIIKLDPSIHLKPDNTFRLLDIWGKTVKTFTMQTHEQSLEIQTKGTYFLTSRLGYQKIMVR